MRGSRLVLGLTCLAAISEQALPQCSALAAENSSPVDLTMRRLFASHDYNNDGRISPREATTFGWLAAVSMDADSDARISLEEFLIWDPGFRSLAEERGELEAYDNAQREVFEAFDRDRDGLLSEAEISVNIASSFVAADADRDGWLTPEEFVEGFPILAEIAEAMH